MAQPTAGFDTTAAASLWWPVMSSARWFQGKSRQGSPTGLVPQPWLVDTPALRVRPELLDVSYDDGGHERYQLLVAYRRVARGGPAVAGRLELDGESYEVSDAPRDPDAMAEVLHSFLETRTFGPNGPTTLAYHAVRPIPSGNVTPMVFTGEQSNTNVVYGDSALLKVFRKLEPGPNLDREITERLLRAGVGDVPVLYGWLDAAPGVGDDTPDDLMMLTQLLPEPVDGWVLATHSCRADGDFTSDATALGHALGQIHAALAEPTVAIPGDEVADAMEQRLLAAVSVAPALEPYRAALAERFAALRGRELPAQTVHGDFHLGQTLKTPIGWRIIDFEGEPMKSMAERRRPDSPWRDVAGMLRSLSYATSAANAPHGRRAAQWLQSAREAFLRAYRETAGSHADETTLTAYEADKAAYEVVYETRNRPSWVHIPLGAVAALCHPTAHGPEQEE